MSRRKEFDALQDRLIEFGLSICRALRTLDRDRITDHFLLQLVRCSSSPAGNYSEARSAESKRDFIHKMQICLKELRETDVWLRFIAGLTQLDCNPLRRECGELTAIFVASITTARKKLDDQDSE